jgi:MFS transporter, ACS family, tartrate transporter
MIPTTIIQHFEQAICFPSLTNESDCDLITAQQMSHCLTSVASRDRVAASFTLFRPVTFSGQSCKPGRTLIRDYEKDTGALSIEARTTGKIRLRIIPFMCFLYLVAFLDRTNIGFAALTMNRELAITSQQFGLLAGIFFFGYFFFEIPSNLLLHRIGARVWIARILITWGAVAALTGFVHTVHQLYVVRFLLGLAEAGYYPGVMLYLTYWFRQQERAQAVAWFLTGLPAATIVGAPISGLILDHVHWLGVSSWRWLLILEGVPAIACGLLTYYLLPSRPHEAEFLTTEEKEWVGAELAREEQEKLRQHQYSVFQTLTHGRVWFLVSIYFGMNIGVYTLSFFSPQLVKSLSSGYSNSVVGFLVMIPNLFGFAAMILVSRSSDRTLERRYHVAIPAITGAVALALLPVARSTFASVALLSLLAVGVYSFVGPFWALPGEFLTGFSAAAGIALINCVGNLGSFTGPYVIGSIGQKTGNLSGGFIFAGIALLVAATLVLLLPRRTRPNQ